jgi:hypothetical protein
MTVHRFTRPILVFALLLLGSGAAYSQAGSGGGPAGSYRTGPSSSTGGQPSGVKSPSTPGMVNNPTSSGVAPGARPGVVNNPTPAGVAPSSAPGQPSGSSITRN